MLNGKNIDYTISSRGTFMIDGNKGKNIVSVTYQPSKLLYIGMIISVVTWIGLFKFFNHKIINSPIHVTTEIIIPIYNSLLG